MYKYTQLSPIIQIDIPYYRIDDDDVKIIFRPMWLLTKDCMGILILGGLLRGESLEMN